MPNYVAGGKTFRSWLLGSVDVPATGLVEAPRTILGYGYDGDLTTVGGLPNIAAGATHALVSVEGAGSVRYRQDAASPAATASSNANCGPVIPTGAAAVFVAPPGGDLTGVKLIAVSGTPTISVEYQKIDS